MLLEILPPIFERNYKIVKIKKMIKGCIQENAIKTSQMT